MCEGDVRLFAYYSILSSQKNCLVDIIVILQKKELRLRKLE